MAKKTLDFDPDDTPPEELAGMMNDEQLEAFARLLLGHSQEKSEEPAEQPESGE